MGLPSANVLVNKEQMGGNCSVSEQMRWLQEDVGAWGSGVPESDFSAEFLGWTVTSLWWPRVACVPLSCLQSGVVSSALTASGTHPTF